MKELLEILSAWRKAAANGQEAVLATVVQVSGSTYRKPGARMLLTEEGRQAGSISGGCLEGDLLKKAWWRTEGGKAALVTYDSTDEDEIVWGFGLGCNGVVQVLIERLSPGTKTTLDWLQRCLERRQTVGIATVFSAPPSASLSPSASLLVGTHVTIPPADALDSPFADTALAAQIQQDLSDAVRRRASAVKRYELPGGAAQVFLEVILPPLPLLICGAGHDAVPLARFAKALGWHVTVADFRAARPKPERFPDADAVIACAPDRLPERICLDDRTAAVIMSHNYPDDKKCLQTLLSSPISYLGLLGPRRRAERLLAELEEDGATLTPEQRKKLHGPVGLDIGADNPDEIALAIVAEVQARRTNRNGGLLRDRQEPNHQS